MVHARLKFTLTGQPRTALLTDRGWTLISGTAGQDAMLNHLFPLPLFDADHGPDVRATEAAFVAAEAARLLRGIVEP